MKATRINLMPAPFVNDDGEETEEFGIFGYWIDSSGTQQSDWIYDSNALSEKEAEYLAGRVERYLNHYHNPENGFAAVGDIVQTYKAEQQAAAWCQHENTSEESASELATRCFEFLYETRSNGRCVKNPRKALELVAEALRKEGLI